MIAPKPLKVCHPPRLKEVARMTMIGAISCVDGTVMLADGQETITDYAKWTVQKIKIAEVNNAIRIVMTGAGRGETIDMIWEKVSTLWGSNGSTYFHGYVAKVPSASAKEWRESIVTVVREITKQAILPLTDSEVELLWFVQDLTPNSLTLDTSTELFKTHGLNENNIRRFYFGGNPVLLTRFLSDQYLSEFIYGVEEARAIATYIMWEAKQYDPTVGKQSDIIAFKKDGTIWPVTRNELDYWEEHFRILKRETAPLPLLSCAGPIWRNIDNVSLERLRLAFGTLIDEQRKLKSGKRKSGSIDKILVPKIRRLVSKKTKPSIPETSGDQ